MTEIEIIERDFIALIEGVKSRISRDILTLQAEAIMKNFSDFIDEL